MHDEILSASAEFIAPWEGCILEPHFDPVGLPTIGIGHLLSRKPWTDLEQWNPLPDEAAALDLLARDLVKTGNSVRRLITVPLNENQEVALVSFAFNVGSGNLQASTLRRVVNRGDFDDAPAQFRRWVYARGRKLRGLVRRREAEAALWMS